MYFFRSVLFLLLTLAVLSLGDVAQAQEARPSEPLSYSTLRSVPVAPNGSSYAQSPAWERAEKLDKRHSATAAKAIKSMCDECLGSKYNKLGPKTPLTLPEELSTWEGEPQLETEP
ncbi:hypothetical protein HPT29_018005 [Microvirga terrae]|uniref:Uncharacterized protein n=1 Tax=Microvirga terrae TaxID=2740529 RepID=A0ABY5RMG6_9HYPH|nr:hypothetical protein [Microvirga terrae]UVF18390.1 hypothetical protein HPT29_018005 [Microvirga terrae]